MEDIQYSSERLPARGMQAAIPPSFATYVDCWAIVVGISKYKHESLNLKYADRDAEEFYGLLLSTTGGGFKSDHVIKLTNHEATTANVTKALRSFLKKPGRDDLVIIYCACHGSPDLDRPENVYLLTHDTDPNDIAGTALPMREIDLSLRENLLSERVVIFADTCHSAAIGGGMGRRSVESNTTLVNRYLQEVSSSRAGIALLTSAEANEVSFEDARWGGGHGVFTHYLLKGMQGEADQNQNGFVTIGELFEYVRAQVQVATDYRQHPAIGTNPYDRNLPLAITSPTQQNYHSLMGTSRPLKAEDSLQSNQLIPQTKPKQVPRNKRSFVILGVVIVCITGGLSIGKLLQQGQPDPIPSPSASIALSAKKLLQELDTANIYFSEPQKIHELENTYSNYPQFAKGCLKFLAGRRIKQKIDFLVIYYFYTNELKNEQSLILPDGDLDTKKLRDAMVLAYKNNAHGVDNVVFEEILETD
jgi:uncharacterized caspase-like protein